MTEDLTLEQKRYLEGFAAGISALKAPPPGVGFEAAPSGPDAAHIRAQNEWLKAGKKLSDPEKWKREEHPFDAYRRLKSQAAADEAPKPPDNFRWRFYGLFHVAPAQDAYMCRLRIPNGILRHWQLRGLADLAERFGAGHADMTTRANLQMREIAPRNSIDMIEGIQDLGLNTRGSGADNIRNVTGDATAGIAPRELLDTRVFARRWHFHILNDRSLYGIPRKFNLAFDGGGPIPTLEETNDVGFQAVHAGDRILFRLLLGGITGHGDIARDTGIAIDPDDTVDLADAILRVFIEKGDRTNRAKARLKYVLEEIGIDGFIAAVEARLGRKLPRVPIEASAPRPARDRDAHIGAHAQKQDGLFYIGALAPKARLTAAQMRAIAALSEKFGDGDIRLTVWQNFLLSGVPQDRVAPAMAELDSIGLLPRPTRLRAGLVACTGSKGCKLANADTKSAGEAILEFCEARLELDVPINIHITGCPNSCAQHFVGDIGLVGTRIAVNDEGDTTEGYHVVVGGGYGASAAIGRELYRDVEARALPSLIARMLRAYLAHRSDLRESFQSFAARHDVAALTRMIESVAS